MDVRGYFRHLDYFLLVITLGLIGYGATMIYFATRHDPLTSATYYARSQLVYAAVGFAVLVAVSTIDYERYRRWQWALYAFALVTIAAVFALGPVTRGSRRWLQTPFMNFQPSELALWIVTVTMAAFLVDRMDLLGTRRITVQALAYVALPAALIFFQPDFGTATVFIALTIALLLFYGTRWTHFATLFAASAVVLVAVLDVLPALGLHLVKQYQIDRLLVFLHPGRDPGASGYNVMQSMIAVGSGSLTGRGNLATQTQLDFLPEHHTDFIFAVVSERYGFVGAALLIGLYVLLIWRALRIATLSRDMYGSMMAGGIAVMFLFQAFVNIGMTIGIMPVTGIPLPFVSYGGAALITSLMLVGLLESIHVRARHAVGPGGQSGKR
jgi:rod shape determining protein RodA